VTITLSTFKATRGNLQSYGDPSAVLKVMVLDETVIDNEDELVVKVTDLSSEVTGGTYAATTLTGVDWDLTGDQPALRADDVTIEGLDLPGPSPLPRYYVVFCDDHDDTDRIDDLVAILEATPAVVVGDQPISWPGGIIATIEQGEGDADARLDLIEAWTVAGVPFVDGDVDAEDLAAALAAFIGSGGTTVQSVDKTGETPGVVNIDLSTGADAVADDVAVVAIMGPSGGDCEFVVTPPSRSNGLALGIYAYCPGHFATITIPASGPLDEVSYGPVVVPVVELVGGAAAQTPASGGGGAVDSVNGQTGVVVLDADDIGDGTTNKAYTAAEQSKLAAITGTNTGDQTLPTLSSLGAVPTSRTLAGLDLSADRTASALRTALGLVLGTDVVPMSYLDTDGKLAADSDSKLATQKATKSYVDVRFPIHRSATSSRRISTRGVFTAGAADGMTTTGDRVYAPIFLPAGTYNTLSIRTTTAGTSTWRLGVHNGATGDPTRPGTVLVDAGTVDTSVTAALLTKSSLNFVVPADGWYWCCAQVETYTSAPALAVNHAANNADTSPFPGWPGQEANYLRPYTGYWDLSPSAGALTTANAITGNSSTGLDYAANVPRFWVGP